MKFRTRKTPCCLPSLSGEPTFAKLQEKKIREAISHAGIGAGVHIHIGADGHTAQTLRNLTNLMASYERLISDALIIDRNRMNHFCRTVNPKFLESVNKKKPTTETSSRVSVLFLSENSLFSLIFFHYERKKGVSEMSKNYCLAYGSNLNLKQMTYRCPTAKPVGTAVIKGYQLLFKGSKTGAYLTIEKAENSSVPVAVREVGDGCMDFGFSLKHLEKALNISETAVKK